MLSQNDLHVFEDDFLYNTSFSMYMSEINIETADLFTAVDGAESGQFAPQTIIPRQLAPTLLFVFQGFELQPNLA